MSWAAPLLIAAALAARSPDQRQAMVDLAYVLGEAHALRQACDGAGDQTWRLRMNRMIAVEQPDEPLRRRMVDGFNAGFMTRQAEFPLCGPQVPQAAQSTAAQGRALAQRLGPEAP